ncbi:proline--tRNA ligase [Halobacteriales archaeon QS_1_68_20]|nr:MAG: proline--tRNA ligase [Halobacteriales archaeon QS_1_68_20]
MRRSNLFIPTTKEADSSADVVSAELAIRSGLVRQLGSGVYNFTPVGKRVFDKISEVTREEMRKRGAQEVKLPYLQYSDIWRKSGRYENFEGEMFTFENRDGQEMCLAPTHEEAMADLVRETVRSTNELPLNIFQIGRKYRDDHARNGLLRTKEFTMKDAYSFHASEESLDESYRNMRDAYISIFERLGVEFSIVSADTGVMGGSGSEEFQAPAEVGSDEINYCTEDDCRFGTKDLEVRTCQECGSDLVNGNAIEIGHIFKLGTRYSEPLDLTFDTETSQENVIMGSYGLGVTRLIPTLIEQNYDDGMVWPEAVAPFKYGIVPVRYTGEVKEMADRIEESLDDAILFDHDVTGGEKFAEADLMGVPYKVVLGNTYTEEGQIEVEDGDGEKTFYDPEEFLSNPPGAA